MIQRTLVKVKKQSLYSLQKLKKHQPTSGYNDV